MAGLNENKMAKQESLAMTAAQNSDIRVGRFLCNLYFKLKIKITLDLHCS